MNKTDLLFRMMEHPLEYTDTQWREILLDDECRELYVLMAKTRKSYAVKEDISEEEIDAEWERFEHRHIRKNTFRLRWFRVAAIFLGVLMLSGIGFAAIRIMRKYINKPRVTQCDIKNGGTSIKRNAKTMAQTIPLAEKPIVFDNVPLEKIVREIAVFHDITVDVQNKQTGRLRFYFVWQQKDSLHTVVGQLNQFGRVNVAVEDGILTVK